VHEPFVIILVFSFALQERMHWNLIKLENCATCSAYIVILALEIHISLCN
jgi:hypothetical protein